MRTIGVAYRLTLRRSRTTFAKLEADRDSHGEGQGKPAVVPHAQSQLNASRRADGYAVDEDDGIH